MREQLALFDKLSKELDDLYHQFVQNMSQHKYHVQIALDIPHEYDAISYRLLTQKYLKPEQYSELM